MMRRAFRASWLFAAALLCIPPAFGAAAQRGPEPPATPADAPRQPIAFSHKVHAGTGKIPCKMCHPNPDPGEMMTIVEARVCMQCHSAIKADSPEIKRLAEFAKSNTPIPWAPVYELPSFVKFSHRVHLDKGNTCQECHGQVAQRDQLYRETSLTMGTCMNCHQAKKATLDCAACHELPN